MLPCDNPALVAQKDNKPQTSATVLATNIEQLPASQPHRSLYPTIRSRHDPRKPSTDGQPSMALELYIPRCVNRPRHRLHPPPPDKPLRIRIQGPLETIQKLLPDISWHPIGDYPQPGGLELARLTHRNLYGGKVDNAALTVRDEYLAWVIDDEGGKRIPQELVCLLKYLFDDHEH